MFIIQNETVADSYGLLIFTAVLNIVSSSDMSSVATTCPMIVGEYFVTLVPKRV